MVGFRVVVAFAPEERTGFALHCAVLRGAILVGIAERSAVGAEVVVAVLVRDPGVLAPSHARVLARHSRLRRHDLLALGVLPRVLGVPEGFQRRFLRSLRSSLLRSLRSGHLSSARELNQGPVVQAPVLQSIIFPPAVLPVAPMVGFRVVVASAPEERTGFALHCAVLRDAILVGIAERSAVGAEVVVAVLVRDPGVLAPSHARVLARHVSVPLHNQTALGVLPRVLGVPEGSRRRLWSSGLGFARELNQGPVVQAPVLQSIIFPSAVLPVAPMVGFRVVVAFAPEERTVFALHCAVLRGAILVGIAERSAVGAEVVVAVLVRDPGVLAPSHARLLARHSRLRRHDLLALGVLPRVLGVPEGFQRRFLRSLRSSLLRSLRSGH